MWLHLIRFFCVAMLTLVPGTSNAQEICKSLLKYGTFDEFDSWSDKERFDFSYHAVCRSNISSFSEAKNVNNEIGVDIIELIGSTLQRNVTEQNFKTLRSQYCSKSYSEASGSSRFMINVRRASRVLSTAFKDCVTSFRRGFSAHVSQTSDKNAFAVHISYLTDGESDFEIHQVSAQPVKISCAQNEHMASPESPIKRIGSTTLNCRNLEPEKSFILAVNTNRGSLGGANTAGVELPGTEETLSDLNARLDKLELNMVHTGTIAFFLNEKCPESWSPLPNDLSGRHVVIVNGQKTIGAVVGHSLKDKENRPVGRHSHSYKDITFAHINGWNSAPNGQPDGEGLNAAWKHNGPARRGTFTKNTATSGNFDGTNAPYVQLLACQKD
jgi:hypothetical protein